MVVFVDAVYSSLADTLADASPGRHTRHTQSSDTHQHTRDRRTESACKAFHFKYAILLRVRVGASFQYSVQLGLFERRVIKLEVCFF